MTPAVRRRFVSIASLTLDSGNDVDYVYGLGGFITSNIINFDPTQFGYYGTVERWRVRQ